MSSKLFNNIANSIGIMAVLPLKYHYEGLFAYVDINCKSDNVLKRTAYEYLRYSFNY